LLTFACGGAAFFHPLGHQVALNLCKQAAEGDHDLRLEVWRIAELQVVFNRY
jgi:hypothetical protein